MVTVRGWRLLVADPLAELCSLDALARYADSIGWRDTAPDGPPFAGGAVGWITDDVSPTLLSLPPDTRPALFDMPSVRFTVHDWAVAVDPHGRGWVIGDAAQRSALLRWVTDSRPHSPAVEARGGTARCGLSRPAHATQVRRILEWIAAGDLYQANLTFQMQAAWPAPAHELARKLEAATPGASHAAYATVTDHTAIVSVSPETFLRTTGERIITRPIKGTRPRSRNSALDAAYATALRHSDKDHAEHLMIVDLERNDLGRVCVPGTVRVPEYAALDGLPTVWHLTSTVAGCLRDDVGLGEVLAATFPPGSVTGTPKRMAVARTLLLEPVRRGVYCGAIGVVTRGLVDLSVAIRTAIVDGGIASYGTGGGIVADSDPDAEYDEALAKAAAFLTATGATPPA